VSVEKARCPGSSTERLPWRIAGAVVSQAPLLPNQCLLSALLTFFASPARSSTGLLAQIRRHSMLNLN